jgi:hypothetical protein
MASKYRTSRPKCGHNRNNSRREIRVFWLHFQLHKQLAENADENSNFIPPALDSEAMTDTMKFLFPITSATSSSISRATHLI